MPEIVSDGDPVQTPAAAADEYYATRTNPGIGSFIAATVGDGPAAFLARGAERGSVEGSSFFDRFLSTLTDPDVAAMQGGLPDPIRSPQMAPEQYNEQYAPRDADGKIVPIGDKPMPEALAQIIGKQKSDALEREGVLSRFAATHSGLTTFAAGSAASLLDPLNAASLFIPGVGEGALAAQLGGGLLARTGARLLAGGATGALMQAPISGLKMSLAPEEASDYGISDAMRDILYGAAGVAALHTGIGTLGEALGRFREPARPGETEAQALAPAATPIAPDAATTNAAMRAAVGQIVEGRPVDSGQFFYQPPRAETAIGMATAPTDRAIAVTEPTVEAQARRVAPDLFAQYDPLSEQADRLRGRLANPAGTIEAEIDQQITEAQAQAAAARAASPPIGLSSEELRAAVAQQTSDYEAAQTRADALASGRNAMVADSIARERAALQQLDFQMRDLAPQISAATRTARDSMAAAGANRAVVMGPRPPLPDMGEVQRAVYRDGYAPGLSQDEFAAANEAVYGPREPTAPGTGGTPQPSPAEAGANPELAAAEEQLARVSPDALLPEDRAELDRTAAAVNDAPSLGEAMKTAASCLMGLL